MRIWRVVGHAPGCPDSSSPASRLQIDLQRSRLPQPGALCLGLRCYMVAEITRPPIKMTDC
eukprot:scaffold81641_cov19-Tisochrysis_lutea.AAC.1